MTKHMSHVSRVGYVDVDVITCAAKQCGHCWMDVGRRPSRSWISLLAFSLELAWFGKAVDATSGRDA
jgi:hypothetical protein